MTTEEKLEILLAKAAANDKKLNRLLGKDNNEANYEITSEGVSVPVFPKSQPYEEIKAKHSIPLQEKGYNLKEADRLIRNIKSEINKVKDETEKLRGDFSQETNNKRIELRGKSRLLGEQLQQVKNHRANIDFNGRLDETMTEIFNKI